MYPQTFAEHLKGWLAAAQHPGVAKVETCADIGRHEQPVGVVVTLVDGWRFVLQAVGSYAPGGARDGDGRPEPFSGDWGDRGDYKAARAAFATDMDAYRGPKPRKPAAGAGQLVGWIADVIKGAGHPDLDEVDTAPNTAGRAVLRIVCADRGIIYGLPVGWMPPGATDLAHPPHQIPKEYT